MRLPCSAVRRSVARVFACAALCGVLASPARADDLTRLLEGGPIVRLDVDKQGRPGGVLAVVDVDAPAERVWSVLLDYRAYAQFMPRVREIGVRERPDGRTLVEWKVDTPLVPTRNTNVMSVDTEKMTLGAKTVEGDMRDSTYEWRVQSLPNGRSRLFHTARHVNMAGIVRTLDDPERSLSQSISLSMAMSSVRALKARAELLERAAHPPAVPTVGHPRR